MEEGELYCEMVFDKDMALPSSQLLWSPPQDQAFQHECGRRSQASLLAEELAAVDEIRLRDSCFSLVGWPLVGHLSPSEWPHTREHMGQKALIGLSRLFKETFFF